MSTNLVSIISYSTTVTILELCNHCQLFFSQNAGCDITKYANVVAWLNRCKTLPGYDENVEGAKVFGQRVSSRLTDKF